MPLESLRLSSTPENTLRVWARQLNYLFDNIDNTRQLARSTTQLNKTNTTLSDITGLSAVLKADRTYSFRAILFVDADVTGGHKYAVSGTCTASSTIYQINSISNTTNAYVINSRKTALTSSEGQAGATTVYTEIDGIITVGTAGTLTIMFAQNAASGTSSVLSSSILIVEDIT